MDSTTLDLGGFRLLPVEIRLQIWRSTLEGDLVALLPDRDLAAYRRRNPVISRINHESREEFKRLHVRIGTKSRVDQRDFVDSVYLNPGIDGLILGSVTAPTIPITRLPHATRAETLIWPPVLPTRESERIREVRLHQKGFLLDSNPALPVGFTVGPLGDPVDHWEVPRLSWELFPNLDTVWVASRYEAERQRDRPPYVALMSHRGTSFRYLVDTGEVYLSPISQRDFDEGMRTFRLGTDPDYVSVVRVGIVRGRVDASRDSWDRVAPTSDGGDDWAVMLWHVICAYIKRRLV